MKMVNNDFLIFHALTLIFIIIAVTLNHRLKGMAGPDYLQAATITLCLNSVALSEICLEEKKLKKYCLWIVITLTTIVYLFAQIII